MLIFMLQFQLPVGNNGVGLLERNLSVILFQILEADLKMEFSSSSNDMLSRLFNHTLDHRIRLSQSLQSFDQLGQISGILGLNSNSDDGRDRELHLLHVVGLLGGGDGSGLDEELINSDQSTDVSSRDIFDGFNLASHHKDGSLNKY